MMNSNFTDKDIICAQGKFADLHPGNVMFRKLVNAHKQTYAQAPNSDKRKISMGIVAALRRFGFNFLKFDTDTGCYDDIGDKKAVAKTSQALREKRNNKGDSNITSSNTSSEECCVNFSTQLLHSLSEEEEPASSSQQESGGMSRRPTLLRNRSMSDGRALLAMFKEEVPASERELSVRFRDISEKVVNKLKEERASPPQQETQESHDIDMPGLPRPTLLPNRSVSDKSYLKFVHLFFDDDQTADCPNETTHTSAHHGFGLPASGIDRLSSMSQEDDNGKVAAV